MDRRGFLKVSGAAAACAAAAANAPTAGAADTPLRESVTSESDHAAGEARAVFASDWPDAVAGPADMARRLSQRLREATGANVELTCAGLPENGRETPPESSGAAPAILRFGCVSAFDREPGAAYFAGLPGDAGLPPDALGDWISFAGGRALWDESATATGSKHLLAGHLGAAPLLWTDRPFSGGLAEFRTLRIGAQGLVAELVRSLGATAVDLSPAEKVGALAQDRVDAVFASPLEALSTGLAEPAAAALKTCMLSAGETLALRIDLDHWNALPPRDRQAIEQTAFSFYRETVTEARAAETLAIEAARLRHHIEFGPMDARIEAMASATSAVLAAELAAHSELTQRIDASYRAFARTLTGPAPSMFTHPPIVG